MDGFKKPHNLPQDLLLIQDLIGLLATEPPPPPQISKPEVHPESTDDDDISSSGSEIASEDEIEAELVANHDKNDDSDQPMSSESDSDSDSDADDGKALNTNTTGVDKTLDDGENSDEESGPAPSTGTYFQTKNEVPEAEVRVPDIQSVGHEEQLEKVGEIMSVFDNVVIVRGLPSEIANRGAERALDSETLLVFDDRSVMGYVYETFGPTSQPLYQVKFNKAFPVDPERVKLAREVFHVPSRSVFIFVNRIKNIRGSDASNVNDEEPADYELDFSDDEAEAAYKSRMKKNRREGSRARSASVASSRRASPTLSQMHDQDMNDTVFSANPYAEHSPYDDFGYSPGPSRPPPIPYDDPYADTYTPSTSNVAALPTTRKFDRSGPRNSDHGHGRRRQGQGRGRGRGRGRGWDRDQSDRGSGYSRTDASWNAQESSVSGTASWSTEVSTLRPSYEPRISRPLSPTSLAIARTTGQLPDGSGYTSQQSQWGYPPDFTPGQSFSFGTAPGYPQPFVQPHINPRFATAFGMGMPQVPMMQQHLNHFAQHGSTDHDTASRPERTDEWVVPVSAPGGEQFQE